MKKISIIFLLTAILTSFSIQFSAISAEAKTKTYASKTKKKSTGNGQNPTSMEFYFKPLTVSGQKGWYFRDNLPVHLKENGFIYQKSEKGTLYTSDDTPVPSKINYYTKNGIVVADEESTDDAYGLYKLTIKFNTRQQVDAFMSSVKRKNPESWTYQNQKIYSLHWLVFMQEGLTIEIIDGD